MKKMLISDFSLDEIKLALDGISNVRAGLLGDMCLDAYWVADMKRSELSRETPHFPLPIVSERYSPGAGGNAASNIAALAPKSLLALGVLGDDWRGNILRNALNEKGIDLSGVISDNTIVTNAYIKPLRTGISDVVYEDPRLDFVNTRPISRDSEEALIEKLIAAAQGLDVLCVSDQMAVGCVTERVRETVCRLAYQGLLVICDSRDRINLYRNCVIKPNEVELSRAMNSPVEAYAASADALVRRCGGEVLVTLGSEGCALYGKGEPVHVAAVKVTGEIDICGAGDTFLSAFACTRAGGADSCTAMAIGALASSVTIRKIGQTGTAARAEILAAYGA